MAKFLRSTHYQEEFTSKPEDDIEKYRKEILGGFGWLLIIETSIVLIAYFFGKTLKKRPGNVLIPYLIGSVITAIHWIAHPFYVIQDPEGMTCKIVGTITVANEQMMRCFEAVILYALWKIYRRRGSNIYKELARIDIRQKLVRKNIWRLHLFAIAGTFYITAMSLLIEEPGRDYYNLCTLQWTSAAEKGPIMFEGTVYIVFCVYNIFVCCDVWFGHREFPINMNACSRPRRFQLARREVERRKKEMEHFQKLLKWYLFVTTGLGALLAGLNFYASWETNSDSRSNVLIITHDILIIIQPLLIMILKLDEPLVKEEFRVFRSWFRELGFKFCGFCLKIAKCCCCCFTQQKRTTEELERSLISASESVIM